MVKIEYTFTGGPHDVRSAAAVVTALVMLHGPDVLSDALNKTADWLDNTRPLSVAGPGALMGAPYGKAADGYPTQLEDEADPAGRIAAASETSAARAFGGDPEDESAAPPAGELDAAGIPWDERIHSGTKKLNQDGTWGRRRNTPDDLYASVMAELKARAGTPAADSPAPPAPPAPTIPAPPPPAAPAAAAFTSTDPISFPVFMVKVTKAQGAKQITKEVVEGFMAQFGLTLAQLAQKPEELAAINAMVDAHIAAAG